MDSGDIDGDGYDDLFTGTQGSGFWTAYGTATGLDPNLQRTAGPVYPGGHVVRFAPDLDGDGRKNLLVSGPQRVLMFEPCIDATQTDSDGDGFYDICDFCPAVFSSGQYDTDEDGAGDACDVCARTPNQPPGSVDTDEDGHCDFADNCPTLINFAQVDSDGDGAGEGCDCQPTDPAGREPDGVPGLLLVKQPAGTDLTWGAPPGADRYRVLRGTADLLVGDYGVCVQGNLTIQTYTELSSPAPGIVFTYLVAAENDLCGIGPLGYTSFGNERFDPSIDVCP